MNIKELFGAKELVIKISKVKGGYIASIATDDNPPVEKVYGATARQLAGNLKAEIAFLSAELSLEGRDDA